MLQREPCLVVDVELRREEARAIAAVGLGLVEREIGAAHQLRDVDGVARSHRDADAGADRHGLSLDDERFPQRRDDALSQRLGFRFVGGIDLDDGEFVAADARHDVLLAGGHSQPLGGKLEQRVAGVVAERIVDVLEAIEIDIVQGQLAAVLR